MTSDQLITPKIPAVQVSDTGERALVLMHEVNFIQLPVLREKQFAGIVSIEDILQQKDLNKTLAEYELRFRNAYVLLSDHLMQAIRVASENKLSVIPVLNANENQEYSGAIASDHLLRSVGDWLQVRESGAIIELEMETRSYTLSELSRLAEDENLKILGLYTTATADPDKITLTIKLSSGDVASFLSVLERFGYEVKNVFSSDSARDVSREHYDALIRYLNP
jgi:CBS domain-containing protein